MQGTEQLIELARQAFHETGWSIKRLSRESGVSYAMAHGFVSGTREQTLSTLVRILNGLGYDLTIRKQKSKLRP
ncbi:MAG: helix-turn-helix transcriptional regulator [Phycisphaerae bacterium]|nr:helix-turn-helix transcriptional regulator [Phycisphaerae bacterium]